MTLLRASLEGGGTITPCVDIPGKCARADLLNRRPHGPDEADDDDVIAGLTPVHQIIVANDHYGPIARFTVRRLMCKRAYLCAQGVYVCAPVRACVLVCTCE